MELTLEEKQQGCKAGLFVMDSNKHVIPTSYGRALTLLDQVQLQAAQYLQAGEEPTKEEMQAMLRMLQKSYKYMSIASEHFYVSTQLWDTVSNT